MTPFTFFESRLNWHTKDAATPERFFDRKCQRASAIFFSTSQTFFFIGVLLSLSTALAQNSTIDAHRLRQAQAYEQMQQFDRAAAVYQSLFEQDPRNGSYYAGLKRALLAVRRFPELLVAIDQRVAAVNDISAEIDRGEVWLQMGQAQQALVYWQELLQRFPFQGTYAAVAARLAANQAEEESFQVYLAGRRKFNDDTLFGLEVADFYVRRQDIRKGVNEYVRYLERSPQQYPIVQRRLLELTAEPENYPNVMIPLEDHAQQHPESQQSRRLQVDVALQAGDYAQAFESVKAVEALRRGEDPANRGQELFEFGERARRARAFEFAEQAYQVVVAQPQSPFRVAALYGLGESLKEQSKHQAALVAFESVIQATGGPASQNAWTLRALNQTGEIYFIHLKDMDRAIAVYRQVYEAKANHREKVTAVFRLGDCYLAKGDPRQAKIWYERARQLGGNDGQIDQKVDYVLARLFYFQGAFGEAQEVLEAIVSSGNGNAGEDSMVNDALELLLLLDANLADSAGALGAFARAEYQVAQQNRRAAIDSLAAILRKFPNSELLPNALLLLGNLYDQEGQYQDALANYRRLYEQHGSSLLGDRALMQMARVYGERLQQRLEARRLYEQLLKEFPQSPYLEEARRQARLLEQQTKSM